MTNPPEAVAWLEAQIELGESAAPSGGWLPPYEEIVVDTSRPGFQMPEELYAQVIGFISEGLRGEPGPEFLSWTWGDPAPIGSPNPEPVEIGRADRLAAAATWEEVAQLTRADILRAYDLEP